MKKCSNPLCETSYLYGDGKTVCPFCHAPLTAVQAAPAAAALQPADRMLNVPPALPRRVSFVTQDGRDLKFYGRISEISHHELFYSRRLKLCNALFRSEPYQLSSQTIEYVIRLESLNGEFPEEIQDFCLYGSYLGRLQPGDEVTVKARNQKGRQVVKSVYNHTSEMPVKPGFQIPSWLIRLLFGLAVLFILLIVLSVFWLFTSGAAAVFAASVLGLLLPFIIGGWLLVYLVKRMFRW